MTEPAADLPSETSPPGVRYAPLNWSSPLTSALLTTLVLLFALLLFLPLHFACQIKAFTRGREGGVWQLSSWWACFPAQCRKWLGVPSEPLQIFPRHLERQVAYLTGRFAPHAPWWQLVIWSRQFSLLVLVFLSDLTRALLTGSFDPIRYVTATVAILIILAFWIAHRRVHPYA